MASHRILQWKLAAEYAACSVHLKAVLRLQALKTSMTPAAGPSRGHAATGGYHGWIPRVDATGGCHVDAGGSGGSVALSYDPDGTRLDAKTPR